MTRRAQINFDGGMNTDSVQDGGSIYTLHDAYVRRKGEITSRGPIFGEIFGAAVSNRYGSGFTTACFHPNFGMGAVAGYGNLTTEDTPAEADGWWLLAVTPNSAGDAETAYPDPIDFAVITENGTGSNKDMVCLNAQGNEWLAFEECRQSITTGSEMIFAGVYGSVFKWGGSRLAPYATGSVSVTTSTDGSSIITGSGTSWAANVEAGQYILINDVGEKDMGSGSYHHRAFRITNVHSNTELEIETPVYLASGNTGLTYRIQSVAVVQSRLGSWNATTERPTGIGVIGYHDSRLIVFGTADNETDYNTVFNFDKFRYSGISSEGGNSTNFFTGHDLWPPLASFEIFPGIGGAARGIASIGADMILIKAHAMFRVVTSLGLPGVVAGSDDIAATSKVSVQIINGAENVGAKGLNAWGVCKAGIVVASSDGLYLYDGSEMSCVTDGKVARWWEENFTGNEFHVLVYEDKVLITPENRTAFDVNSPGNHTSLVWDIERNLFWTMNSDCPLTAAVTLYDTQDRFMGQYAFPQARGPYNDTQNGGFCVFHMTNINHQVGMIPQYTDTYWLNANDSSITGNYPVPSIITSPIPLGEEENPMSEGRINNVVTHMRLNAADSSTTMDVSTLRGSIAPDDYLQTPDTVEYGVTVTDIDRIHRVPVDGFESAPTGRVMLDFPSPSNARIHIFGIGVDCEPSNNIGPV